MSSTYDPDVEVDLNVTWDATFLSDRDVSSQVPINFVPHPGVYVTAACFGTGVYEDAATEKCLSNLLSSQIRLYVIDLYWDTVNRKFGLCPVEIPSSSNNNSQNVVSERSALASSTVVPGFLKDRQAKSTSSSTSAAVTTATSSVVSTSGDSKIFQLGPYQCSNTLSLATVASVFEDFIKETGDTIQGKITTWVLNLHLGNSADAPTLPRTNITANLLPNASEAVGNYLDDLSDILYTPSALSSDRQNLNSSWYRRGTRDQLPLAEYFTTFQLPNGDTATDDGWPDEDYIQVVRGKRLLVGFGDIDDSMSAYNTSTDSDRIYPPEYISARQDISFDNGGYLASGCYYNANDLTVASTNNSWAFSTINAGDLLDLENIADNLTTCGFGQLLNITIDDRTADGNPTPYQTFSKNAVFSWAYGEPQNASSAGKDKDDSENDIFRCALMVSTDAYRGHWRVEYCDQRHRVACREANSPYRWRVSKYDVPYGSGDAACTDDTAFDVPRTGLENAYLYNRILADASSNQVLLDGIWINFNSLDYENCWVVTGVNGTCPYFEDASATHSRQILIPTIAALIVLILTLLTILVKCSANARNSRIRKRGDDGWDYEGVPS